MPRSSIAIVAVTALLSSHALAGGLEVPDLGTVAIGRGTAFVAKADNLSAFYYNPAGLSKSKGPNLLVSGNLVHMSLDYQRAGGDPMVIDGMTVSNPAMDYSNISPVDGVFDPEEYGSVSLKSHIGPAPMLVFNWGDAFRVEGLALSLGLVPPSSFGTPKYDESGPQRYLMREAHFLMMFPGVGVSYAINRYIQVGGVFLSGMGFFEQHLAIRPAPVLSDPISYNEDLGGDADLRIDVKDLFMPTGILGVLSNPLDWLEIGAAVKFPVKIEASGKAEYTAPAVDLPNSSFVEGRDKVTLRQSFPWMVRAGARYVHELFDIEADFVWENWSSLKEFEIDMEADLNQDTSIENGAIVEMPDAAVPKNFRDTYSVRLGGDVAVWPKHLTLRAGAYYQSSAYPENYDTFNLDFPFAEQVGVGGGLTWHAWKHLDVNAGFLHVFQFDVEVENGIVQQQGLPYDSGEGGLKDIGNTVNNGLYEVSMNLFGVSLEAHF
jgi:long-subunit fatty acid transport protein